MNTLYAAVLTLACALAAPAIGQTRLTVAVNSDIQRTDWPTKHDDVTQTVLHHVMEGLMTHREDMTVAPLLAEGWTVSPDGRRYTFKLRSGIRSHNGKPMTAAIVKANWHRSRDSNVSWGGKCRGVYDGSEEQYHRPVNILAVEAPDHNTVVFTLHYRNGRFLHHMANHHCLPGIIHPDSFDSAGKWMAPIGTGPFTLGRWDKGRSIELRRFADYRPRDEAASGFTGRKTPLVDVLTFVVHSNPVAAATALDAGDVDIWHNVPQGQVALMQGSRKDDLHFQQTSAFHQLVLQSRHDPLLRDVRLRQALTMAIDRDQITREVTGVLRRSNPSVVATSLPAYGARLQASLAFDPKRAIALAGEAGYQGQPIQIQASRAPYPSFFAAAESATRMLRNAGFDASVQEVSWPEQDKNYSQNKYQISSITFSTRTDPALMYPAIIGQKTDYSWYLWEDVEAEMLANRAAIESDPALRAEMLDQLHARMIEWTPTIGLFNHFIYSATAKPVNGFKTWPLGLPRFWGVSR